LGKLKLNKPCVISINSTDQIVITTNSMGSNVPVTGTECKNKRKKKNQKTLKERERISDIIGKGRLGL
jgi:hypothetical protein